MTQTLPTWFVVSNEEGLILGVYGSALLSEAQELCLALKRKFARPIYLHTIAGKRPHVGQSINPGKEDGR